MTIRFPWDSAPARPSVTQPPLPAEVTTQTATSKKPRGRRPSQTLPTTAPEWRYHHLTVYGLASDLDGFAAAAKGPGVIPWALDGAAIEEDIFNLAVSQPADQRHLSVAGCRILARQFRERVEARQARAVALVGRSLACPFDLQVLLPVPPAILRLGPTDPTARNWLSQHWGTVDHPRQVVERAKPSAGRRLPHDHRVVSYGFFTEGETPLVAVEAISRRWPELHFQLRPRPG
jgi:hypothetical protein